MPGWLWVVLALLALLFLKARSFITRFRRMCRRTRDELTDLARQEYPAVQVLREERGNLVVRCGEEERVWELADLYSRVAKLPGMGTDPDARRRLYRQEARTMFAPKVDGPLTRALHGALIKPQLLPPDGADSLPAGILSVPVPGLGLKMAYVVDVPQGGRYLTEQDREELAFSPTELQELALANLGQEFPRDLLAQPLTANSGSALQFADGFDAARILLLPSQLRPGEALIAMIPHRDLLLLLPAAMEEDPDRLAQGLDLLDNEHHPALLRQPVRVTPEGFQALA